jgi:hypothetical protein
MQIRITTGPRKRTSEAFLITCHLRNYTTKHFRIGTMLTERVCALTCDTSVVPLTRSNSYCVYTCRIGGSGPSIIVLVKDCVWRYVTRGCYWSSLLDVVLTGSQYKMLCHIYPEYNWKPWCFKTVRTVSCSCVLLALFYETMPTSFRVQQVSGTVCTIRGSALIGCYNNLAMLPITTKPGIAFPQHKCINM